MRLPSTRAHVLWRLAAPAVALLFFTGCRFGAPRGSTQQGRDISDLYQLLFYVAIPVAAIVYGLILWSVIRYRRKSDALPKQFRYHVPLEILYTVIPVLIVAGLFVETYATERSVDKISEHPDVRVTVTGFQWQWRFEYPDLGIQMVGTPARNPELVLPVGRTVQIRLVSTDVVHAFFVPDFLFKRDAIPGFPNTFDMNIEHAGVYRGECAEFCGLDHAEMNFTVRAVSPDAFERWVAEQQRAGGTA